MLTIFTAMHPLVDACSVSVLAMGGMTLERVLAYNALAFALQLPLGIAMDSRPDANRSSFFLGVAMTFAASIAAVFGFSGSIALAAACIGNALFHLTAGKALLESHGGRGGPVGLFISTGAVGLAAGRALVEKAACLALPSFAAALAACAALAARRSWSAPQAALRTDFSEGIGSRREEALEAFALIGLFALIAWRSWAGLFAGGRSVGGCVALSAAGAVAALAGKAAGGYAAEIVGRRKIVAASVAGSAALAFVCNPECAPAWLALLFVAQLATGPVLSMVYGKVDGRGGTAFGLNCLGLFVGSLA